MTGGRGHYPPCRAIEEITISLSWDGSKQPHDSEKKASEGQDGEPSGCLAWITVNC